MESYIKPKIFPGSHRVRDTVVGIVSFTKVGYS